MADQGRVLLTMSGTVPESLDADVDAGRRPRADYREIQRRTDAEVVDAATALQAAGLAGRLLHRLGGNGLVLAWYCFRRRRTLDVILTDGEQVGIPLALMCRVAGRAGCRHVMVVHVVSTPIKARSIRLLRLAPMIDRWIVYCSRQREIVHRRFGVDDRRILLTPFMVDGAFFAPDRVDVRRRRMICAVGLERRDYPTLVDAVDGLDVEVVIAAASPWSRRADTTSGRPLPSNVTVRSYTQFELRELYAESAFSVMPLDDVDFQAGITAILESMAMERPVICTRTRGQTDTIVEGVTGRYVPPADALALRRAIAEMLEHDDSVARMGIAARDWVLEHADVAVYADRLAALVASVVVRPASD